MRAGLQSSLNCVQVFRVVPSCRGTFRRRDPMAAPGMGLQEDRREDFEVPVTTKKWWLRLRSVAALEPPRLGGPRREEARLLLCSYVFVSCPELCVDFYWFCRRCHHIVNTSTVLMWLGRTENASARQRHLSTDRIPATRTQRFPCRRWRQSIS